MHKDPVADRRPYYQPHTPMQTAYCPRCERRRRMAVGADICGECRRVREGKEGGRW